MCQGRSQDLLLGRADFHGSSGGLAPPPTRVRGKCCKFYSKIVGFKAI
jgi:hypothetical protein